MRKTSIFVGLGGLSVPISLYILRGNTMLKSILDWLGNAGVTVFLSLYIPALIMLVIYIWKKERGKDNKSDTRIGSTGKSPTYAPGPYHYAFDLNGVKVVIDGVEENSIRVSVTGTVDKRPTAVVINQEQLSPNLTLKEQLEKYAWALMEVDLKGRNQNDACGIYRD